MMKKEYLTPEMIVRNVCTEGIMQPPASVPLVDDPDPEIGWGDEEAKEKADNSFNIWED